MRPGKRDRFPPQKATASSDDLDNNAPTVVVGWGSTTLSPTSRSRTDSKAEHGPFAVLQGLAAGGMLYLQAHGLFELMKGKLGGSMWCTYIDNHNMIFPSGRDSPWIHSIRKPEGGLDECLFKERASREALQAAVCILSI